MTGSLPRADRGPTGGPEVLVVEHQASCPPGWLGAWLTAAGAQLRVVRPYAGDPLPRELAAYRGLVVLGGSMGAGDDPVAPWLPGVRRLLRDAARDRVPALGVCLGHQLAAVALGGTVTRNPRGQTTGLRHPGWTEAAVTDPLLGQVVRQHPQALAVQWNDDIVTTVPPGAVPLAVAGTGELLAARFAPTVWGVQWHPEAGADIVAAWAAADRERARRDAEAATTAIAAIRAAEGQLQDTWRALADGYAEILRVTRGDDAARRPQRA